MLKKIFTKNPSDSQLMQMVRYLLSGWLAFMVDFGMMLLLHELFGLNAAIAATLGFCAGLIITYLLSIKWIFTERRVKKQVLEFAVFAIIGVLGIVLTYLMMDFLGNATSLHYTILKVITAAVVTIFNFTAKKLLLFSR